MCTYSMVMEHQIELWRPYAPPDPFTQPNDYREYIKDIKPKPEPDEIQRQLDSFQKLLEKAKKYDEQNNQKDCELDEKKEVLRQLAKHLGVQVTFP